MGQRLRDWWKRWTEVFGERVAYIVIIVILIFVFLNLKTFRKPVFLSAACCSFTDDLRSVMWRQDFQKVPGAFIPYYKLPAYL